MNPRNARSFFGSNNPEDGLGQRSVRSGFASIASRGVSVFVQVGSTVVLARMLSPEDFGLVALVTVFTGVAPILVDLGTRDAAVQRPTIAEEEISALFWLTMGIGIALTAAMALAGPLIGSFYNESRLDTIALFSSLSILLTAASCQHFALLRRSMLFQSIALIEVGATVFSSAGAIAIALSGFGYWALVAKPILSALFLLIAVCWVCRWVPGRPKVTRGVVEMVRFGLNVTGFTAADYVGRTADRVAIGYRSGATELGYYQQAMFFYENTLTLLVISLHSVAIAGLSKLADDVSALRRSWAKALSTLAFYAMPAFALLAVAGPDLIVIILGDKWVQTGTLVRVLALRGIPHVVERTLGWLHVPAGRSDRWMRWGLFGSAVHLIALAAVFPFGAMGVAIAYVVVMYVLFVPAITYAGRPLGIGAMDVLRTVGPQLVGALTCAGVGFVLHYSLLSELNPFTRILALLVSCSLVYALVVVGVFRLTEPLVLARSLVHDLLSRRRSRTP